MLWHFIATIVAGFGAAGIGLMIRALTRQKAPKWVVPVFAGAGMLGYQIYWEYSWFPHSVDQLPESAVVVNTLREASPLRPWSYVGTPVSGFTVLDRASIQSAPQQDGVYRFQLYRFERLQSGQVASRPHLLNCRSGELAQLESDGRVASEPLRRLPVQSPLVEAVCDNPGD